jgi:dephospho-CoA kinase
VATADGTLDRAALARLVFDDPDALGRLERIVHPAVRPRILAAIEQADRDGVPAVVVEAIKLVEGGLAELCDEVWLVVCDGAAQRQRLAARGVAPAEADRRIDAQAGLIERIEPVASRTIDSSGSSETTRDLALRAYAEVLAAAPRG